MFLMICQCDQIWQIFATLAKLKSFWLLFEALFCIGKNFEPNCANCYDIG